jgi:FAD/FMN-containing dehydrogenase
MTDRPDTAEQRKIWTNWSGNQTASPSSIVEPLTLTALKNFVITASGPLRVVGAGHSFTPVAATDGTLLKLDRMGLVHSVDAEKKKSLGECRGAPERPLAGA